MDHHCPWINNCVGERNQKYFIQFLMWAQFWQLDIHPNSEIFVITTDIPFFFRISYVGILSGYAISLVAWSWYTECADCPKVIISQDLSIKMTTKKSNWPIRMKKKSEIVAEVSYTTNWCSQDIRLKQSRILHSVLLIMESVIILRHFFRFWVQTYLASTSPHI